MVVSYIADANLIIRFLTDDHEIHSPLARKLFAEVENGRCELIITEICVAEVVWVLTSYYKKSRESVSIALESLFVQPGIKVSNSKVILDALKRFRKYRVDFVDCYFSAVAADSGRNVASFDKDLDKFEDIKRVEPS